MIMRKFMLWACALTVLAAGLASCEKPGNDGYEGTNYIILSTAGSSIMYEPVTEPMVVDVMLTTALPEDLTLVFAVNDDKGVLSLGNNPLTIKAGERTGKLTVVSNNKSILEETAAYSLVLDPSTVLPEGVKLQGGFNFTVNPAASVVLTEEQEKIVAAYREKTGIDLHSYLGLVSVNARYYGYDSDYAPVAEDIAGKTVIVLSEESTADMPVLKMISNPMGIQDKMEKILYGRTVGNDEYLYSEEYPDVVVSYTSLMETLGWSKESKETFSMTLDNLKLNGTSIDIVADRSYDEEFDGETYHTDLFVVPFDFSFSAYEREKKAIADGVLVKDEDWSYDATANPDFHLNYTNIADGEEEDEDSIWEEAKGEISASELKFTFCFAGDNDYWSKVVATYSPNK